ncbi:hypothetical protein [Amycolatopsis thermoflava]|uniref:hypothetical protein n=1 Tax=Amycolatopsis thermoflava TaxID=84480 RepID=UPI003645FBC6
MDIAVELRAMDGPAHFRAGWAPSNRCGRTLSPAPGYPEEPQPVGKCLRVVMNEECEHRRYAVRDLAVLEGHFDRTSGR